MLMFWNQRLVLLSTPKTGSTALETALAETATMAISRPPELKHTPVYRFDRLVRPWLQNSANGARFEAVALIREPIDWLGSWYRFRRRPDLAGSPRSTQGMDFARFVEAYMQNPRPAHADVGAQARFLSGKDNKPLGVDHLYRYEDMPALVAFLEDRLGVSLSLPRVNVSPVVETRLSPSLEARLRDYLRAEYELYAQATGEKTP